MEKLKAKIQLHWTTPQKLTLSFVFIIFFGGFLLSLPISHRTTAPPTVFLDHLFTAVSMICVTGLTVLDVGAVYNNLGQIICIALMQIGGLGLITIISASMYYLNKKMSLKDQYFLQEALNRGTNDDFISFLMSVYKFTFSVEAIFACILMIDFIPRWGLGRGMFNSIFVAVSAFCNAGFDNFGSTSLQKFIGNPIVNFVVTSLIICGGLGFSVWFELRQKTKEYLSSKPRILRLTFRNLSVHTRLAITATVVVLTLGTTIGWLVEHNNPNTIGNLPLWQQWMASYFQAVTMRTAGFATINYENSHPFSNLMYIFQMIIGGAPGGTAGGIKVTTAAMLFLLFISELKGYSQVVYHKRTLPSYLLKQAMTITLFFLSALMVGFSLLLLTEPNPDPFKIMFEAVSAICTVGVSMNYTGQLTTWGRIIIMSMMFIGRVGPITVLISIISQRKKYEVRYADAEVLLS
ncbi:TrkH family potassium uptake protein [Vaginisenegalia massiliensis]|uniref:TrkH family potassium uptake protein n=1 Tax=Vaginisenegalia massiliensis TaxID=2058294 RepID=UPI001F150392|nr:potassium transporter TrkG [Vaginisenegalia massiliensis]